MADKVIAKEQEHSALGGSIIKRLLNCPGSYELAKRCPPSVAGKDAAMGTAAHALAEAYLLGEPVFEEIEVEGHTIAVDQRMEDAVGVYVSWVRDTIATYNLTLNLNYWIEKEVQIDGVAAPDGEKAYGKADFAAHIRFDRIIVSDYKNGGGVLVDVEDNEQLLFYALGVYLSLHQMWRDELKSVELVVVQPNHHLGGISSTVLPISVLHEFHRKLIDAAANFNANSLKVTGDWCRYCPGALYCEARQELQTGIIDVNLQDMAITVGAINLPHVETMTPERVGFICANKKVLEDYLDQVWALAERMQQDGIDVPNTKLVDKIAHRRWENSDEAEYELHEFFGDAIFKPTKLRSPKQIEDMIKEENKKRKASKTEKLVIDLERLTMKPDNGQTLVLLSDRRKKVQNSFEKAFEGVTIDV